MTNKYRAKKTTIDGVTFDSIKESKYYLGLKAEAARGEISNLIIHPKYPILINDIKVCDVELDFVYFDNRSGKQRYIDVKGWCKKKKKYLVTSESALKKKMVEAYYGFTVEYA